MTRFVQLRSSDEASAKVKICNCNPLVKQVYDDMAMMDKFEMERWSTNNGKLELCSYIEDPPMTIELGDPDDLVMMTRCYITFVCPPSNHLNSIISTSKPCLSNCSNRSCMIVSTASPINTKQRIISYIERGNDRLVTLDKQYTNMSRTIIMSTRITIRSGAVVRTGGQRTCTNEEYALLPLASMKGVTYSLEVWPRWNSKLLDVKVIAESKSINDEDILCSRLIDMINREMTKLPVMIGTPMFSRCKVIDPMNYIPSLRVSKCVDWKGVKCIKSVALGDLDRIIIDGRSMFIKSSNKCTLLGMLGHCNKPAQESIVFANVSKDKKHIDVKWLSYKQSFDQSSMDKEVGSVCEDIRRFGYGATNGIMVMDPSTITKRATYIITDPDGNRALYIPAKTWNRSDKFSVGLLVNLIPSIRFLCESQNTKCTLITCDEFMGKAQRVFGKSGVSVIYKDYKDGSLINSIPVMTYITSTMVEVLYIIVMNSTSMIDQQLMRRMISKRCIFVTFMSTIRFDDETLIRDYSCFDMSTIGRFKLKGVAYMHIHKGLLPNMPGVPFKCIRSNTDS